MWKLLAEGKETKLCFNHDLLRVTIEQYSSVVFTDANSLDIEVSKEACKDAFQKVYNKLCELVI